MLLDLGQQDDFFSQNPFAWICRPSLDDAVLGVVLQSGHEEDLLTGQLQSSREVLVAPIENQYRAGLEPLATRGLDVGRATCRDNSELRQVAVAVQHQVRLDGPFAAPVLSPVEQAQTKRDHASIHTQQFVLEAELAPALLLRIGYAALIQRLENALIQLPRPVLIGIDQSRAPGRRLQPQRT
jgi:hypothetical protein